jgi:hypothetical protein
MIFSIKGDDPSGKAGEEPAAGADERRLTSRMLWRWRDLCDEGRSLPRRSDIHPAAFGADWRSCFLLDLAAARTDDNTLNAVFVYLGDDVAEMTDEGAALVGRSLAEVVGSTNETLLGASLQHVGFVLERRAPVSHGGEIQIRGRSFVYRCVLLPLTDEASRIDAVLGAVNGREIVIGVAGVVSTES